MSHRAVDLLKADLLGEHRAIVQYLFQAYMMGEGDTATEMEAIAREEMRHLDWLADIITELGGDPTMERDDADFSPGPVADQLRRDVALEQEAIDQYRAHMEEIEDEGIRLTLARIVHDEAAHKGQFVHLAEVADRKAASADEGAPAAPTARLLEILNQGIRHEYSVILQYLYHSFVTPDKEIMEKMQNIAINEMQHLGWLSEHAAELGGIPDMERGDLVLTSDHREMLAADIAVEREVTRTYSRQIPEVEDEGVRALLTRIRDHEIHHDAVFGALLERVAEEEAKAAPAASEANDAPAHPPVIDSLKE